ncbi:RNA polymerase sigma factor [Muriicola soli]|uniref:Sigma-70 family RNA polymerase sigma factor n=1 Tax=Muriicola soli TaxID=2507538 RepID=A0A411EBD9_9FLAO|nr:sigma-70 family RNA polymerase sigma factor [Muriicola soli]QBA64760.1 sigma-70 family RNA polymerase sigma factor [Muriicola soli]
MTKELPENVCKEETFKSLYDSYATELHNYLYYKYGEKCSPNDTTQEAFIKLWENCKKVVSSKARAFLYKVANNSVLNDIKHHKVVLRYRLDKPSEVTNEDPEYLMRQEQYFKKYQQALAKLTEEQRVAFLLNKVEAKKHKEIAELLGVTRKVVEYRIYSAFNVLKEELDEFHI